MRRITESTKKIITVELPDSGRSYEVGFDDVTRILAYEENGEMAHVPWLAICRGTHVWKRLPARFCVIQYAPGGEEEI